MKILYVGGSHFFNRFSNLEAAIERANDGDIIELHKDVRNVSASVTKSITINGNGHVIIPKEGKTALNCISFVELNDISFDCGPKTTAVIIRNSGNLNRVITRIVGTTKNLYPTVVQRGGRLVIENSQIMFIETYKSHDPNQTETIFQDSVLTDYYKGLICPNNSGRDMSKFRGKTMITDSVIGTALLEGDCRLSGTILMNFNKANGIVHMAGCKLYSKQYDRQNPHLIPYALHVMGGAVIAENYSSCVEDRCIGFYMTNGTLTLRSANVYGTNAMHLIKDGVITFNHVYDEGFYKIEKARCSIIQSRVRMSNDTKSAMDELNAMIGLEKMKNQLRTILNTINVNMKFPAKDFGFSHHMIFAGDPGTGKTTVAKLVARALFEIGAVPENKYMEVPASQLIKGYVGQTGAHVESVLKEALGGVLFIDEAYELMVKDGQNTFNNDVLTVLLRYMEDHRDNLVVIAAGYEKEMKEFLASNPGLARRFQWVEFEDYTPYEMAEIAISMSDKFEESYGFADVKTIYAQCFERLSCFYLTHPDSKGRTTNGGNGGLARNLFQQVIFARNNRVVKTPESGMTITYDDIQTGFDEEWEKAVKIL